MRGENAAPHRDDLDLRQISPIVPNLLMLDRDNLRQTTRDVVVVQVCQQDVRLLTTQKPCQQNDVVQRTTSVQAHDTDAGWDVRDEFALNAVQDQGHAQP